MTYCLAYHYSFHYIIKKPFNYFVVWTVSSPCFTDVKGRCLAYSLCVTPKAQLTIIMERTKRCTDCKIQKPITDFYKSKTHSFGVMCYCKNCFNKRVIKRWIQRKIEAIQYKGSECKRCGLHLIHSHYSVFEFHHVDHTQKDCDWSKLRLKTKTTIKNELDKCLLLCANCHRIIHSEEFPDQPKSR